MNPAILVILFFIGVVGFLLLMRNVSQYRKSQAVQDRIKQADEQLKRLENLAADVSVMIGDVAFEQVNESSPGEYDIWFSIFIRRTNKHERFSIYTTLEQLLPFDDYELDRELTKEVRKRSAETLGYHINSSNPREYSRK